MYIILSLIVLAAGILMLAKPELVYSISESWKHDGGTEPSNLYVISIRTGGAFCVLVGAVGFIILVLL